ncbi:MAG: hypothetical protein ABIR96_01940 [Bdellovibrionota bacterium]
MKIHPIIKRLNVLSYLLLLGSPCVWSNGKQLNVRVGMLKGSYSGPVKASFMTIPSVDVEMELFQSSKVSTLVKANISMNISKAKIFYSGVGAGQRYYFGGPGMLVDRIEGDYTLEAYARNRYFAGWEVGVAQVLVKEYTATYSVVGSVVEFGAMGGYIYQVSKTLGLSVGVGGGFGMGFTTVSVNGINIRMNAGLSYIF